MNNCFGTHQKPHFWQIKLSVDKLINRKKNCPSNQGKQHLFGILLQQLLIEIEIFFCGFGCFLYIISFIGLDVLTRRTGWLVSNLSCLTFWKWKLWTKKSFYTKKRCFSAKVEVISCREQYICKIWLIIFNPWNYKIKNIQCDSRRSKYRRF